MFVTPVVIGYLIICVEPGMEQAAKAYALL